MKDNTVQRQYNNTERCMQASLTMLIKYKHSYPYTYIHRVQCFQKQDKYLVSLLVMSDRDTIIIFLDAVNRHMNLYIKFLRSASNVGTCCDEHFTGASPPGKFKQYSECIIICHLKLFHFGLTVVTPQVSVQWCTVSSKQGYFNIRSTHVEFACQHIGLAIQFATLALRRV